MKNKIAIFKIKFKLSAQTIYSEMKKIKNLAAAVIIAIIFFELIYWMFNFSVLTTILFSGKISFIDKIAVLISPMDSIVATNGLMFLLLLMLVSLIQGVSIVLIAYIVKKQRKIDDKLIGGSSFITLLAIIGLGCPSCGTSLLTPIVTLFASTSAVALSEQIIVFILPISLVLGIYSLYSLGIQVANVRARDN